jgi:hypothetical protein
MTVNAYFYAYGVGYDGAGLHESWLAPAQGARSVLFEVDFQRVQVAIDLIAAVHMPGTKQKALDLATGLDGVGKPGAPQQFTAGQVGQQLGFGLGVVRHLDEARARRLAPDGKGRGQADLASYLDWYNRERFHFSIEDRPPEQVLWELLHEIDQTENDEYP